MEIFIVKTSYDACLEIAVALSIHHAYTMATAINISNQYSMMWTSLIGQQIAYAAETIRDMADDIEQVISGQIMGVENRL